MNNEHAGWNFNALLYQEANRTWVAHCLELDIVGTGSQADDAFMDMIDLVDEAIVYAYENDDLEHLLKAAPREIVDRFFNARPMGDPIVTTTHVNLKRNSHSTSAPVNFHTLKPEEALTA